MVVELAKLGVCGWLVSSLDGAFGSQHGQHWRRTRAAAETAGCCLGRRRSRRKELRWMRRRARAARCGAHRQSKFALGGSVGLSVGRSVGSGPAIDLPSWSVSCRVVCACWGSVFPGSRNQDFFVSALVCVRRSVCGCVSVRLLAQFLRRGTPLFFPSVLSFVLVCARAVMGSAGVVLASVSASASAGSSGGCCWWERSRAHARVLSGVF